MNPISFRSADIFCLVIFGIIISYKSFYCQYTNFIFTYLWDIWIEETYSMKLYKYKDGKCNASGTVIRKQREKAGLSQEQLAAKLQLAGLDLNQKAVSRIETGERVVPDFELLFFSEVLDVPICTLLGKEGITR